MTFIDEKFIDAVDKLVGEVTDYGFNDEYGYYHNWADGVRPIIEKSINILLEQALKQQKLAIVEKIKVMQKGWESNSKLCYDYKKALSEAEEIIKNI